MKLFNSDVKYTKVSQLMMIQKSNKAGFHKNLRKF